MNWFLFTIIIASWMLFFWLVDYPTNHIEKYLTLVKHWNKCNQCDTLIPPIGFRYFVIGSDRRLVCTGCYTALSLMDILSKEVGRERADQLIDGYLFTMELFIGEKNG